MEQESQVVKSKKSIPLAKPDRGQRAPVGGTAG
jgi:hypothetical protein